MKAKCHFLLSLFGLAFLLLTNPLNTPMSFSYAVDIEGTRRTSDVAF